MTPENIALVKQSFGRLQPRMGAFTDMFYIRLFDTNPDLCLLFGGKIDQQSRALASMLAVIVKMLDAQDKLLPMMRQLGQRHAAARVRPEYYALFGDALMWTLEQMLQGDFTPAVQQAWQQAYGFLADNML